MRDIMASFNVCCMFNSCYKNGVGPVSWQLLLQTVFLTYGTVMMCSVYARQKDYLVFILNNPFAICCLSEFVDCYKLLLLTVPIVNSVVCSSEWSL
jgi:hypothetical protein